MKPCKTSTHQALLPRSIDDLFRDFWGDTESKSQFAPRVNVTETPEAYVIRVDLPGVEPSEVEVSVTPDGLTLGGKRVVETQSEGETAHITERVFGSFSRSFTFPIAVDPDEVVAQSKRGVLSVEVKKAATERARRIEIQDE